MSFELDIKEATRILFAADPMFPILPGDLQAAAIGGCIKLVRTMQELGYKIAPPEPPLKLVK
jgi:hypothetical protein